MGSCLTENYLADNLLNVNQQQCVQVARQDNGLQQKVWPGGKELPPCMWLCDTAPQTLCSVLDPLLHIQLLECEQRRIMPVKGLESKSYEE